MNENILWKIHYSWNLVLKWIVPDKGTNYLIERHRILKSKLLYLQELPDLDNEDIAQNYIDSIGTDIVPLIGEMKDLAIIDKDNL